MPDHLAPVGATRDRSARGDHDGAGPCRRPQRRPSFGAESRAVSSNEPAAIPSAAPSDHRRALPTSLRCSSTAATTSFMSGRTAAALYGFDGFTLRPPFHVTVLRGRNVQRAHHHIHTTVELAVRRSGHGRRPAGDGASENADRSRPLRRPEAAHLRPRLGLRDRLDVRAAPPPADRRPALTWSVRDPQAAGRHRGRARPVAAGTAGSSADSSSCAQRAGLPRPSTQQVLDAHGRSLSSGSTATSPAPRVVVELLGLPLAPLPRSQLTERRRRGSTRSVLEGLTPLQFTYDQVTLQPRIRSSPSVTGGADGRRMTPDQG